MKRILLILLCFSTGVLNAQFPLPALVGYFHNWQSGSVPYIQLDQIDPRYNVVEVSFAIPAAGTDYQMEFVPDQVSPATFAAQIQTLKAQGRKILISIGGATATVNLSNTAERDSFVNSMMQLITFYDFDGIDLDLEGSSVSVSGGTIANPVDQPILNLIDAVKQIMQQYRVANNKKLLLTMAPETAFVQGGQSAFGSIWGAYLPVIHALRDSLDLLQVQLYNSGSMYGIDGNIYSSGTADFIVAMTEAVIQGFNTGGGAFQGLPAEKVAVGLPACSLAAGSGFTDTATVSAAIRYLLGTGPQPGTYVLSQAGGYPMLGGMMTWSINWDALGSCGGVHTFAENYVNNFGTPTALYAVSETDHPVRLFPNPAGDQVTITWNNEHDDDVQISCIDMLGQTVIAAQLPSGSEAQQFLLNTGTLSSGVYMIRFQAGEKTVQSKKLVIE